jgi:hypothetical protein
VLVTAVGSRWCRTCPPPNRVRAKLQKQTQGIESATFFESKVCVLHVCSLLMHHTMDRNQHFSVPRSVQQLVSAARQGSSSTRGHTTTQVPSDFDAGWAWLFIGQLPGILQLHLQMHEAGCERTRLPHQPLIMTACSHAYARRE